VFQQRQQQRPTTPRAPAARLWNPQNFSPRSLAGPNVPVEHPDIASGGRRPKTAEQGRDEYPLLTLPEQRRSRQSLQATSSLQVERSSGNYSDRASVGLPADRRSARRQSRPPREEAPAIAESSRAAEERERTRAILEAAMPANEENGRTNVPSALPSLSHDPVRDAEAGRPSHRLNHSSSKASLPTAAPRSGAVAGAEQQQQQQQQPDREQDEVAEEEIPWGPSHPCFPHMNPHVPLSSPEYATTRIIRVRRDWMQVGDLAPTFANLYPEILDPLVSEDEFRRIIQHINKELVAAFSPWSARALFDAVLGMATLWLWDDIGLAGVKGRLKKLEDWVEKWNRGVGSQEGVKIIPLRRTAYMTVSLIRFPAMPRLFPLTVRQLDFEIPDPHISVEPNVGSSRPVTDERSQTPAHPPVSNYGLYPINVSPSHGDGQQHLPQAVAVEAR